MRASIIKNELLKTKMKNVAALLVMLLVLDSATATKKINTDFLNLLSSKTSVRSS